MAPILIQRAKRNHSGRIPGVGPPQLIPRALRMLTPSEYAKVIEMTKKREAVQRESMALLASLGLNPTGQYVFHRSGAVTERGNWRPRYD